MAAFNRFDVYHVDFLEKGATFSKGDTSSAILELSPRDPSAVVPSQDHCSTIATKFPYSPWHYCHTHMCSHILLFRRSSVVLTLMAFYSGFRSTPEVDNPGDAWFCRARGPRIQKVVERRYLPCVHHRGILVVLPCESRITVLGSTWALLPLTSTWRGQNALFLHTFTCIW